jgi:hypothetical protein
LYQIFGLRNICIQIKKQFHHGEFNTVKAVHLFASQILPAADSDRLTISISRITQGS